MNGLFNSNIVILILFGVCCGPLAFILGIVGLITCTDPTAKRNALVVTILGAIFGGLGAVSSIFHSQFGY